jgi:propionyl-CoA carboxylase beta chain
MVEGTSYMYVTGPSVVKTVTHEEVTHDELGGAAAHTEKSGVAHFRVPDDAGAIACLKRLLGYLPQNNTERPPPGPGTDDVNRMDEGLDAIVPTDPNRPYDIREVVRRVVDDGDFFEVHACYAENLVVGFAHLGGRAVGIVANQPRVLAGCLDIHASLKGARFVRFCDCFHLPLVTFEDVPGFLPGTDQEWNGIIKHGAKLLYAYCEATVPKLPVITRKAYGGAYDVMSSKHIRGDLNLAWPSAEVAVMGAKGAAEIVFRREIAEAEDPVAAAAQREAEYRERFANPWTAAERGYLDDVIAPRQTRPRLISALAVLETKRDRNPPKKHGNIPL